MTPPRRALATLAAALLLACAAAGAHAASFPMPRNGPDGPRAWWSLAPDASARPARPDSQVTWALWRARLAHPASEATALHVLAGARFAAGDTAGADSCWRALLGRPGGSPWDFDTWMTLATRAQARGGAAAAESVLEAMPSDAQGPRETAAVTARRATLLAALGDTARARSLARSVVLVSPSALPAAAHALALLDSLAQRSPDSLALDELRGSVEVDVYRGMRSAAIGRLKRVIARTPRAGRFGATLRLAQVLRDARMPLAAGAAADSAAALAAQPAERAAAALERARSRRDAGATDSALAIYARLGRGGADLEVRSTAWWEYAREAQDRARYRDALEGFARASQLGGKRAEDACFQSGLLYFTLGESDSARAWWRRAHGENARFWYAVALRASDRPAADSLLRALAVLPGYGFYRAAARETLGVSGWRAFGTCAVAMDAASAPFADDVRALLVDGRADDAAQLLRRWLDGDRRVRAEGDRAPAASLALAALAYDAGRYAYGTRLAEAAFAAAAGDSEAWRVVPWAYPPAFERDVVAAETLGVERALLWALIRQESRFDPRARSKSDALGLTQLKRAAASDMARLAHEAIPEDEALFVPGRAIRYGARYLAWMLRRFDGCVPVALAAYNAGPGTIRRDWREIVARGGEALFCELASNADSQDYARRIIGFRSAYRDLQPTAVR